MENYTIEELKGMETLEVNEAYGELKVDTDKERVYIDSDNEITELYWLDEENEWGTL